MDERMNGGNQGVKIFIIAKWCHEYWRPATMEYPCSDKPVLFCVKRSHLNPFAIRFGPAGQLLTEKDYRWLVTTTLLSKWSYSLWRVPDRIFSMPPRRASSLNIIATTVFQFQYIDSILPVPWDGNLWSEIDVNQLTSRFIQRTYGPKSSFRRTASLIDTFQNAEIQSLILELCPQRHFWQQHSPKKDLCKP